VNVSGVAGQYALIANPLDNGTNTGNDELSSLPPRAGVQVWSGTSFTPYTKTTSGFTPSNPSLPVGAGFFVKATANWTNTFVGNVVPAPGGNSSTNSFVAGQYALLGSILPVSGTFADTGTNTLNIIGALPPRAGVQLWSGTSFTPYTKTTSGFTPSTPAYTVGEGFFVKGTASGTWVQTLQ
jgi:hypothetical protein